MATPLVVDARCSIARGSVLAVAAALAAALVGRASTGVIDPAAIVVAAVVGFGVAPLTLVERVAQRRWPRLSPGFLVWVAGFVVLPLVSLQASWVLAAMRSGFDGAMQAFSRSGGRVLADPFESALNVMLASTFAGLPFAFAAQVRARGSEAYVSLTALIVVLGLPLLCVTARSFLGLVLGWHLLLALYALGDGLDRRLARLGSDADEHEDLARRFARGELSWSRVWLLAYLGYEPARAALPEPPTPSPDLLVWCRGLELAGRLAVVRAAAAVGALVVPPIDSTPHASAEAAPAARTLGLVDAWVAADDDLRPALREQVMASRAGWDDATGEAALALRAVVDALEGQGTWAVSAAARALSRAADHASRALADGEAVRAAIRRALIDWANTPGL